MKTKVIYGEDLANKLYAKIKSENDSFKSNYSETPGIAFIGFPGVPLGKYNIPFHVRTAEKHGFEVFAKIFELEATEGQVIDEIEMLNNDEKVTCIEVLQPLPAHLNPLKVMSKVKPEKEMEGFHPVNMNRTLMPDLFKDKFTMCLPYALKMLWEENNIVVQPGNHWVLLIDDEFLKNPLVNLVTRTAFMQSVPDHCSQTIVNYDDPDKIVHCKRADYLVVVTKKILSVKPEWLKKGVCIIDIYSNLLKELPAKNNPSQKVPVIRGGVDVESVQGIANAIVPIPGGLMGVVLAIMLKNTIKVFQSNIVAKSGSVV